MLIQEILERLVRDTFNDGRQQTVAGVGIIVCAARFKIQRGRKDLFEELFLVGRLIIATSVSNESSSMGQEMVDGDPPFILRNTF